MIGLKTDEARGRVRLLQQASAKRVTSKATAEIDALEIAARQRAYVAARYRMCPHVAAVVATLAFNIMEPRT